MTRHRFGRRYAGRSARGRGRWGLIGLLVSALVMTACTAGGSGESSDGDGKHGGTLLVSMIQEPGGMNELFHDQSGAFLGGRAAWVVEPLFIADLKGNYKPHLAAEVPTLENGGISEDQLTVTYKLRKNITWSDGKPFTADDVVFTWKVFEDPGSQVMPPSEAELIESVKAVDKHTVEVKMAEPNPGYLELWKHVLPEHKFESTSVTREHPQAQLPLGTGPFVFESFKSGDRIELKRNSDYWRDPNLPYLDGITLKITPDAETAVTSYINGEFDTLFFFSAGDLARLEEAERSGKPIKLHTTSLFSTEYLFLNHSEPGSPGKPHPVLGDKAIRKAIDMSIDRQGIIDNVLDGFGSQVGSPIAVGQYEVGIPATKFDPESAKKLLDKAGWTVGDNGIRSKDGVRASLKFQTISGDQERAQYQQVMQQNLKKIGIEINIENVPSNLIFGSYGDGGLLATGNYDLMMSRDAHYIDPVSWVSQFTCDSIPSKENPARETYAHYCNPEYDRLVNEVKSTLDSEKRQKAYDEIAKMFVEERLAIPVYGSAKGWSWTADMKGVNTDYWLGMWLGAAEWYLER